MYDLFRSILFGLEAERAHRVSGGAARMLQALRAEGLLASKFEFSDERLRQSIWGVDFENPVGLAAGFDKNARLIPFWNTLGFGFAEVGSVSARASKGNPRPRAFRLPEDRAIINRMGLNNDGARRIRRRISRLEPRRRIPVGINLAKTHDPAVLGEAAVDDFRESFQQLAPLADYVALNISCPNTADGKTFEDPEALDRLLEVIMGEREAMERQVPVLVKLSPPASARIVFDSAVEEMIELVLRYGADGFIATNTTTDREDLMTEPKTIARIGAGGLSGAPIEKRSTRLIRYVYRVTDGKLPIIGVGGVFSAEDAYRKIRAGASLVQIYTGLVYEGPSLVRDIKEGLVRLLERDGIDSIADAVGADVLPAYSRVT